MKELFSITLLSALLLLTMTVQSNAQANIPDYKGYLGALDTVSGALDTTAYVIPITGTKANITFVIVAQKLSGTVAGTYNLYGSADGTTYVTAAVASGAITNVSTSQVLSIALTTNSYSKYKLILQNTNASSAFSQRSYVLYRQSLEGWLGIALCTALFVPMLKMQRRQKRNRDSRMNNLTT